MSGEHVPVAERRAQLHLELLAQAIAAVGRVQQAAKAGDLYFGSVRDRDAVNKGREALDRAADRLGAVLEKLRDNRRAVAP